MPGTTPSLSDFQFLRLVEAVHARSTHRDSCLHGESHWRAVTWTALELAPRVPGADAEIGFFFGLLHDTMRLNDGRDPDHGPRASIFTAQLAAEGLLMLDGPRLLLLCDAIARHTFAGPTDDPTLGLCWDSDRLNLWRVGTRPQPRFLSTGAARDSARIVLHQSLPGQHESWPSLWSTLTSHLAARPLPISTAILPRSPSADDAASAVP